MTDQSEPDQNEDGRIIADRRTLLMTLSAAGVSSISASDSVSAQSSGNLTLDNIGDGYAMNPDGKPDGIELSGASQFVIETPSSIPARTTVVVSIYVRPAGSGDFEEIARASFLARGQTQEYVIEGDEFTGGQILEHSEITTDMWNIPTDMDALEDQSNRHDTVDIDIKTTARIRGQSSPMIESNTHTFSVTYAKEAGLGRSVGYAVGTVIPFNTDIDGFEGTLRTQLEENMDESEYYTPS